MIQRLWRSLVTVVVLLSSLFMPYQFVHAEGVTVKVGVGDTTTLIQGTTSPMAIVTFMDGASVIGTTTAGVDGEFSKLFTTQTPGLHTYQIYAEDGVGRLSDTVSISTSVQEHQQTTVTAFLPPTIALSDNEVTQGQLVLVSGATAPNVDVILYIDQGYVIIPSNASGNWSHELNTTSMVSGEHQLYAVAVKSGGAQSYPTEIRTLIIHSRSGGEPTTPPAQPPATPEEPTPPVTERPSRPTPPRITSPDQNDRIEQGWVQVCGTAMPGTQIELWNRGQLVGSAFADERGRWCIRLYLRDFSNELKARACRQSLCSSFSGSVKIFRETPARSDGLKLTLNRYRILSFVNDPVILTARISGGEKPYSLIVNWGDNDTTKLDPAHSPQIVTHRYEKEGRFNATATATDTEGGSVQVSFSVEVARRNGGVVSWVLPFILPAVVVAITTVVVASAVVYPQWWRSFWRLLRRFLKLK